MKKIVAFVLMLVLVFSCFCINTSADVGDNIKYEYESNNSYALADRIYNDYTVHGQISSKSDVDLFRFDLSSTSNVSVLNCISSSYVLMGIFDSNDECVAASSPYYDDGSYFISITKQLSAGTYYVLIMYNQDYTFSSTKTYTFYIEWTQTSSHTHTYSNSCDTTCNSCGAIRTISHTYSSSSDTTCNVCGYVRSVSSRTEFDEVEPNSTMSTADRIYSNYMVTGYISSTDIDYYKFVLTSASTVTLANIAGNTKILVAIFDSNEKCVAAANPEYYNGNYATYISKTLSAGTYYVIAFPESGFSYTTAANRLYVFTFDYTTSSHTHTYSNSCDTTCDSCGATRSVTHTYSSSCDTSCDICGMTRTVSHSWDSGVVTKQATCAETGVKTYTCNICNNTKTEIIDKITYHTYSNDTDATCNVCNQTRTVIQVDNSATVYSGTCGTNVNWRITKNGTLVISGTGNMYGYDSDGAPWGDYSIRKQIKAVQVLSGVTSVGNYAFYFCGNILSVYLAETVKSIGEDSFSNCESLREINIPYGIKTIPKYAFSDCSSLTNITLPSSVQSMGQGCFKDCSSLTYFIVPYGVREIPHSAFWNCSMLEYVQIPSSVTEIGTFAFHECGNLLDIYYGGTQSQWNSIDISSLNTYNEGLLYATMHYSSKAPCITCTYGSYSTYNETYHIRYCTNCNNSQTVAHNWDSGVVTKEPTCSTTGIKTYTCSVCNGTKTETISKNNDHKYGNYTSNGASSHSATCTLCGNKTTVSHTFDSGTTQKLPTCATEGSKVYQCSGCGYTKTESIPKTTTHSYGNYQKIDDTFHAKKCSVCGVTGTKQNHSWDSGRVIKAPTCKDTGTEEFKCNGCGATKTETIEKLKSHNFTNGICDDCGKEREFVLGDISGDEVVDTTDMAITKLVLAGIDTLDNEEIPFADLNGDGDINTSDLATIKLALAGILDLNNILPANIETTEANSNLFSDVGEIEAVNVAEKLLVEEVFIEKTDVIKNDTYIKVEDIDMLPIQEKRNLK